MALTCTQCIRMYTLVNVTDDLSIFKQTCSQHSPPVSRPLADDVKIAQNMSTFTAPLSLTMATEYSSLVSQSLVVTFFYSNAVPPSVATWTAVYFAQTSALMLAFQHIGS